MIQIEYFDCAIDSDNKKADEILKNKKIIYTKLIGFPYLAVYCNKTDYFDCSNELDNQKVEQLLEYKEVKIDGIVPFYHRIIIWDGDKR